MEGPSSYNPYRYSRVEVRCHFYLIVRILDENNIGIYNNEPLIYLFIRLLQPEHFTLRSVTAWSQISDKRFLVSIFLDGKIKSAYLFFLTSNITYCV